MGNGVFPLEETPAASDALEDVDELRLRPPATDGALLELGEGDGDASLDAEREEARF